MEYKIRFQINGVEVTTSIDSLDSMELFFKDSYPSIKDMLDNISVPAITPGQVAEMFDGHVVGQPQTGREEFKAKMSEYISTSKVPQVLAASTACLKCNGTLYLKTVTKEGKNKGRKFYSHKQGHGCDNFVWAS